MVKCKICGKELKNPNSQRHIDSKYHQKALKLKNKNVQNTSSKKLSIEKPPNNSEILLLKKKVIQLEEQMKFVLNKISELDLSTPRKNININFTDNSKLKNIISSVVKQGQTITIDDLISHHLINSFPTSSIESAILELIDEEIFDASEGLSDAKLQGNIGRIIKR